MYKNNRQCDVLIIGGGPAGMMAAVTASELGAKTVLLEKNSELGIKLMMTGKGRCNITNAEKDKKKFLEMFGKSGKFLYSAFNDFGVEETVEFFETRGLATKIERGNRIFPVSDKADDVRRVLVEEMRKNKVQVLENAKVLDIIKENNKVVGVKIERIGAIEFGNLIIATGGLSYPYSGSSGDGFSWAEKSGHRVVAQKPALTPLVLKENWVGDLEGLSLRNVRVSVYQNNKKQDERFGEAIFTDKGISGPVILDMSKKIGELLAKGGAEIEIDFKPALDFSDLDLRIQGDFAKYQNKAFKNALDQLLPQKLIPTMIVLSGIDPRKKVNMVTKEERRRLLHLLKEMRLKVDRLLGFDKAVVTSGGVSLREVDPQTMRSKLVDNLYFAGEILDLDAPTGGYNLQESWSTGHLAGKSAAENMGA